MPKQENEPRGAHIEKLIARNRAGHSGAYLYEDAEWMRTAYLDRKLTYRQMAEEAACGLRTITRWMRIHGVPVACKQQHPQLSRAKRPRRAGGAKQFHCIDCKKQCSYGSTRCHACRARTGALNPRWLGDDVGYGGLHARIVASRGKASEHRCAHCRDTSAEEWAYDRTDPNERRDVRKRDKGPYSLDIARYLPLCVPCHRGFDPTGGPGRPRRAR